MKNEYEIRGEVTAIIINSPKYGRQEALISTNKLERANEYLGSWYVFFDKKTKSLRVMGNVQKEGRKQRTVYLHRWITNANENMVVDHFDHDTLNNTEKNLRVITNAENQQNLIKAKITSKSGIRNVSWHKKSNKWIVQIQVNKVLKHIGIFDTIEEAELASIDARKKYMPFSQEATA